MLLNKKIEKIRKKHSVVTIDSQLYCSLVGCSLFNLSQIVLSWHEPDKLRNKKIIARIWSVVTVTTYYMKGTISHNS